LFKLFIWIADKPFVFWGFCLVLLSTTWIDYEQITIPQLGLLMGTTSFPTFPVLQYLPYYMIGMYFANHKVNFQWKYLACSLVGTFLFIFYLVTHAFHLPERFPPSIYWIVGPTFILYLYYLLSKLLDYYSRGLGFLRIMGENVLIYLLLSNIIIFSLSNALGIYFIVGPIKGLFFCLLLLMVITYLIKLINVTPDKGISKVRVNQLNIEEVDDSERNVSGAAAK